MWISLSVFRALSKKPTPSIAEEIVNPFTPTLDKSALDKIKSRIYLDDSQIPDVVITKSPVPTPTTLENPTPIPLPTPATDSGTTI